MLIFHGTKKFLDRASGPTAASDESSTTTLGNWYVTVLFWKPQVALFVNEPTLLPVLVPLAPASGVVDRFPAALAAVLRAHDLDEVFIQNELGEMTEHRLDKTKNRSVVGIMNEFAFLAHLWSEDTSDLTVLSLRLAGTPCGPLRDRHVFPDRELMALASQDLAP